MPTRQEIDKLKADWANDSIWDLEDTDGFEEHQKELLTYRTQMEARWHQQRQIKFQEIATDYGCPADPKVGDRINYYDYQIDEYKERAYRLLHHYLQPPNNEDAKAEIRHLVELLVDAAATTAERDRYIKDVKEKTYP